jgi:hypothetical protein
MDSYREILFSRAFKVVHGMEYNRVSQELRDQNPETLLSIYEIVLQEKQSWDDMKERVYSNLVKYLKYKGLQPESGVGLVVSLFFNDHFYLIEGPDFLHTFCEIEGLDTMAFHSQVLKWLRV